MRWVEIKVMLEDHAADFIADVVSDMFSDFGIQGTVIEDPRLTPEEGWGEDAVPLPEHPAVIGYFPENERVTQKCAVLEQKLSHLQQETGTVFQVLYRHIDEEDWAHAWKAFFEPRRITDRIVVKPTWKHWEAGPDDIVIEIDPGMAFGTGLHPTTLGCIEAIQTCLKTGDRMLDVGTGSGILMAAGAKLGASMVCGVDTDETAVSIARENMVLNGIDSGRYGVLAGHLADPVRGKFDVVVANILSEVILRLLEDVGRVMTPEGMLIASGIVEKNKELVIEKMRSKSFEILSVALREGWATIAAGFNLAGRHIFRNPPDAKEP